MSVFLRKYNTLTVTGTTAIRIPMIKRAVVDFAVGADWTPAAGDVKIAIDGAAAANVTNLPTAVAMGNAAYWEFILTAAELTSKSSIVTIADSATKAVEDNAFIVETYGNASAMYQADLSAANLPANLIQVNAHSVTDTTSGVLDVNTKNINNVAAATPGASGGILISGSNSGTTTLAALTVTGATTMTGGLAIAAGATITGSTNGVGLTISGGGTSGAGLVVNTTSGDAVQFTPTAGHGVNIAANGSSKHGIFATGGTTGTSDGIKAAAGSGGVDIRGNITGNLVGTVSTLTTYTGNTVQTGDAYARLGAPAGASTAADIAAVKVDTAAVKVQTDKLAFTVTNQVDANVLGVAASASNIKKNAALSQFVFLMTDSTNHNPATGLTVSGFRSIDGAAFAATNTTTATEIANGFYKIPLAASDLNGNVVALRFTATAADDQDITIVTQP